MTSRNGPPPAPKPPPPPKPPPDKRLNREIAIIAIVLSVGLGAYLIYFALGGWFDFVL